MAAPRYAPAVTDTELDAGPDAGSDVDISIVRLDPDLPLPAYAHPGDAGCDLVTTSDAELAPGERTVLGTGLAIALPEGFAAFVHPRSGLAARHGVGIVNSPGTVDAGYRGELQVVVVNHDPREVLRLRFGLGGEEPMTLKKVGERLGLTRERVRQVEVEALRALRERLEAA